MDFKNTRFTFKRSITSYTKIQTLIGRILRNKKLQVPRNMEYNEDHLNVGCGPNINKNFINLDYSWRPGIDLCWDISKQLPINNHSIQGIYTEHCLEHIDFSTCQLVLDEFYRILKIDGVVRIIVPDAELYFNLYHKYQMGEVVDFPYNKYEEFNNGITPIMAINRVFRDHGHLFAYDFETLSMMLKNSGFDEITKVAFMQGKFKELLIDSESREVESLYIEAIKRR